MSDHLTMTPAPNGTADTDAPDLDSDPRDTARPSEASVTGGADGTAAVPEADRIVSDEAIRQICESLQEMPGQASPDDAVIALYTRAARLVVERLSDADDEAAALRRSAQEQTAKLRSDALDSMSKRVGQFETEYQTLRDMAEREAGEVRGRAHTATMGALDQVHQLRDQLSSLVEWTQDAVGQLEAIADGLATAERDPDDGPGEPPGAEQGVAGPPPPGTEPETDPGSGSDGAPPPPAGTSSPFSALRSSFRSSRIQAVPGS